MAKILSILIPTLTCRAKLLFRLIDLLDPQLTPEVELLYGTDDGAITIGAKRNALLDAATGQWVVNIDDDDCVTGDYVARIVKTLKESNPDVIGFHCHRWLNGKPWATSTYSIQYKEFENHYGEGPDALDHYNRPPTHLCPARASIVRQVRWEDRNEGEDQAYALKILPLLKTEVFIKAEMYFYYLTPHKTDSMPGKLPLKITRYH